jgi:hypothetical protein
MDLQALCYVRTAAISFQTVACGGADALRIQYRSKQSQDRQLPTPICLDVLLDGIRHTVTARRIHRCWPQPNMLEFSSTDSAARAIQHVEHEKMSDRHQLAALHMHARTIHMGLSPTSSALYIGLFSIYHVPPGWSSRPQTVHFFLFYFL